LTIDETRRDSGPRELSASHALPPLALTTAFRIPDLAELFGITVQSVHEWIQSGKIRRFARTSERGDYRIPKREVVRLLRLAGREVPGLWTRRRVKLLVVDDYPPIRRLAEHGFRHAEPPFAVRTAATVEDGLVLAAQFEPDVILLDEIASGEGLSSEQALRFVRRSKVLKTVKVIATSADGRAAPRMLKAGADGFLEKPFGFRDLKEAVLGHLPALRNSIKPRHRSGSAPCPSHTPHKT
jgi:CheY-like chemotaxis protein